MPIRISARTNEMALSFGSGGRRWRGSAQAKFDEPQFRTFDAIALPQHAVTTVILVHLDHALDDLMNLSAGVPDLLAAMREDSLVSESGEYVCVHAYQGTAGPTYLEIFAALSSRSFSEMDIVLSRYHDQKMQLRFKAPFYGLRTDPRTKASELPSRAEFLNGSPYLVPTTFDFEISPTEPERT
jgi:hypothetical protein